MYKSVAEAYLISVSARTQSSARVISLSQCIGVRTHAISLSVHQSVRACISFSAHRSVHAYQSHFGCNTAHETSSHELIGACMCCPFVVRTTQLCSDTQLQFRVTQAARKQNHLLPARNQST